MIYLVWSVVILAALALYFRQLYSKFSKFGVKHFQPVPFLGNMGSTILRLDHFSNFIKRNYDNFKNERFVGIYEFLKPKIIVRDIELIKKITIKDFEYFIDHQKFVDETVDPLMGRHLIALKGQEWKDMRSTLSPAFTSSKIRLMVPFMVEVGNQMIEALKMKIKDSGLGHVDVEAKDLTTRYANDVIASCAFGLKVDSHMEEKNDFYKNGKEAANVDFLKIMKLFFFTSFPKLVSDATTEAVLLLISPFVNTKESFTFRALRIKHFSDNTTTFFKNLILTTMRTREKQNIVRPDMIHLLMEAKKGQLNYDNKTAKDADAGFATVEESFVGRNDVNRVWSDNDLIAQAILFFIAGFETVSSAMSFALHELAVNADVQEKLAQEIKENEIKNNGKFDYNSIQEMTYMDMVVSEVLRLWPSAYFLDRICVKDYSLGKPNCKATKEYIIRKGENIAIPAFAIHRDPEHFADPLKFDPERFSEENKHKIQPFAYMPFGIGPRNCIGSRFALCEMKVMLYQLLQHMELTPCEKTCIPTKLTNHALSLQIQGGHWIRLKIRS